MAPSVAKHLDISEAMAVKWVRFIKFIDVRELNLKKTA
ncbi:hypothetical protein P186_2268 [Pyrobaculum ferrireducens]|uniref:Uncharacterized protein n=1 Tax=Pyrobaculum ferrireducens TaxID=1104324 RepID=G7VBP3_9CREN|nr:hypothetical protein P186_2268 [Pyrobaculum ferrireducens]